MELQSLVAHPGIQAIKLTERDACSLVDDG